MSSTSAELDPDAERRAVLAQRTQQIDPCHPVERVVGECDRLSACTIRIASCTSWLLVIAA